MAQGLTSFQADQGTNDLELLTTEAGAIDLVYCDGRVQVAQALRTSFLMHAGEWFLDQNAGVDYAGQVLVKAPQTALVHNLLQLVVSETEGVLSVQDVNSVYNRTERSFLFTFTAVTPWGNLPAEASITSNGAILLLFKTLGPILY